MVDSSNHSPGKAGLTKVKGVLLGSLLLGTVAFRFLTPFQSVHADNRGHEDSDGGNPTTLLGTWIVQEVVDPKTVPPGVPLNFIELDTFDAGGGYISSNNGPGVGDPPGQGNWVRTGDRQFALTQLRMGIDADKHFTLFKKIRSTLTLNKTGDEFTLRSQVDLILPNGSVLPIHPESTAHGTRMVIEPLN